MCVMSPPLFVYSCRSGGGKDEFYHGLSAVSFNARRARHRKRRGAVADTFQRCQICVRGIKASPSLFICPCHLVGERGARGVPPAVSPLEKSEGGGF